MVFVSWEEFRNGLFNSYGPNHFFDFFGEFMKLQQVGSVIDYQEKFEKLLAKVGHLGHERQVS